MDLKKYLLDYDAQSFFDELINKKGEPRIESKKILNYIQSLNKDDIAKKCLAAESTIKQMGISFTVYTDKGNIDRAWPFDIVPRVIKADEWNQTQIGLKQRLKALNCFIHDIYHDQEIIKDKIIPDFIIRNSKNYLKACEGMKPAYNVWANICGTDLVRDRDGKFYVLEDNLRVPSGVSYMLENRSISKRVLPELFKKMAIAPVSDYPSELFDMLASLSACNSSNPVIVVLTPGVYNSAYFEHAFLAQKMGAELVEGNDLLVKDDFVYLKTISGLEKVDVIYRRIDDLFMDPEVFQKDSVLGCKGLMRAWQKGHVAIANAPGSGVADDKVVYAYVPDMIQYYLNEAPILNNIETYLCHDDDQRSHVINNLENLVVKPANESGGYGIMVGSQSTKKQRDQYAKMIEKNPRNYVAQPILGLSTAPCLINDAELSPRHLDLRPFILQGKSFYVTTGGLTRVAMHKGSLVVNSSQGGGSKDTWIVGGKKNHAR